MQASLDQTSPVCQKRRLVASPVPVAIGDWDISRWYKPIKVPLDKHSGHLEGVVLRINLKNPCRCTLWHVASWGSLESLMVTSQRYKDVLALDNQACRKSRLFLAARIRHEHSALPGSAQKDAEQ